MPAKLVRLAVLGEEREGEAWGWYRLLPSFLSAPQAQAEDGCRAWRLFVEACSEPLGSGAVTSHQFQVLVPNNQRKLRTGMGPEDSRPWLCPGSWLLGSPGLTVRGPPLFPCKAGV